MIDLSKAAMPKSDQLNADDLIGRDIVIEITKITGNDGEQPVSIFYVGDNGKPWKPCKSMIRVLMYAWGSKAQEFIGRKLRLYRDPKVKFGGLETGGIRISEMSHIDSQLTMALTATKGNKKPYTVKPLVISNTTPAVDDTEALKATGKTEAAKGSAALKLWWNGLGGTKHKQLGAAYLDELKVIAVKADTPPADAGATIAATSSDTDDNMSL